ncbi:hypothetical protein BDV93DRAFT_555761 [Ceratobasidium sp. AG-I]|nr:hypothetical protein BDV93DRAFT_555761 [Ceratobasidium sp. AG-I]
MRSSSLPLSLVVGEITTAIRSTSLTSPQQPTLDARAGIHIHDTTVPITLNFHSPPLPLLQHAKTSTAQLNSRLIAMDFIAAFLTYQLLRVVVRWLFSGAFTFVRAQLGVPTGRTVPVAQPTQPTTASAIERHARSLGQTVHSETAILPREPSSVAESAVIQHPRSNYRPDSISSTAAGPSIEVTLLIRRPDYGGTEFVIEPTTSHPNTQHAIAIGSSENAESSNQSEDGSFTPPRSSSGHLVSAGDDDPSLAGNSADLIAIRSILALSILAVGRDWAHRSGWHLPGIAHDINWLKWICSGLNPTVTLDTLTQAPAMSSVQGY